jgi:pimeloyl-ACP methyl ester carboxylesterase
MKLYEALSKEYIVHAISLPGFFNQPEPSEKSWNLESYARFVETWIKEHNVQPDAILGYSFGSAVALAWKQLPENAHNHVKLILVSPAIKRDYKVAHSNYLKKIAEGIKYVFPRSFTDLLSTLYLSYVIKNPYVKEGTRFLQNSYKNIVKIDSTSALLKADPGSVMLIFGEHDTATPPDVLKRTLGHSGGTFEMRILKEGTHDIANSHVTQITSFIKQFLN